MKEDRRLLAQLKHYQQEVNTVEQQLGREQTQWPADFPPEDECPKCSKAYKDHLPSNTGSFIPLCPLDIKVADESHWDSLSNREVKGRV